MRTGKSLARTVMAQATARTSKRTMLTETKKAKKRHLAVVTTEQVRLQGKQSLESLDAKSLNETAFGPSSENCPMPASPSKTLLAMPPRPNTSEISRFASAIAQMESLATNFLRSTGGDTCKAWQCVLLLVLLGVSSERLAWAPVETIETKRFHWTQRGRACVSSCNHADNT